MNLYIESFEGGVYLVSTDNQGERQLLRDKQDKPRTFHCLSEIRSHFAGKALEEVWLKQSTPYDEMCGQAADQEKLEMQLNWH